MKPKRSSVAVGVMLAAMLVWLVVRSHLSSPSSPPPPNGVSTTTPGSTSHHLVVPPDSPLASTMPPNTQAALTPTPSLSARLAPPPNASPAVSPNGSIPVATDTIAASSESASINAIRVRRMITDYHTLTGENPVGTNAEIMAAVMGKNPRQAVLGPPDGLNLNSKGELVDDWGTPYFFHQLSKDVMEIHSAGPDRIMGTTDDVIVR